MAFEEHIQIPKARLAVLIGKKGTIKKEIEQRSNVKLKIISDGTVQIFSDDAYSANLAKNVVFAIGRGFNPEIACELLKENFDLNCINLENYFKRKSFRRIKGVIIGEKGKTRRFLEEHTKTHISIYGKTICIIGPAEGVALATRAIEMFLTGASHSSVYKFLERYG